jgi:hypothetical protein
MPRGLRPSIFAVMIECMTTQRGSDSLRLSKEQAAEVRRRLAEPNPKTLTLAEFN